MSTIMKFEAPGHEVKRVIEDCLEPALDNLEPPVAIISMLSMSVLLMRPDISIEKLQECVMGTSSWMVTFLSSLDSGDEVVPVERMN